MYKQTHPKTFSQISQTKHGTAKPLKALKAISHSCSVVKHPFIELRIMDMEEHPLLDTVFSCVMPYIHDGDDRNSLSLVSRKLFELDRITRKQVTVHVHYLRNPSHLSERFPNIESLTVIGLFSESHFPRYSISPWIRELVVSFKRLNALCIRDMHVDDEDLELLGSTRGKHLRVLKIEVGCGNRVSNSGLVHIAKYCNQLRTFCFEDNYIWGYKFGNCLHELALHNKVIESLHFSTTFDHIGVNDLTLLAKNCSKSLVSLKISPCSLSKLGEAFRHAVRLEDSDGAYFDEDDEYVGFKFPPNMRCLGICDLSVTSYPFVLPLVNQLRELNLLEPNCQCLLIERCPNLEVLHTEDICGDRGLQVIVQVCKKLRKLSHLGRVTHMGLISLAQGCCNLEYLHVTLTSITNEALECIGTHLKNLGDLFLILGKQDGITDLPLDNGVRGMLNGCNKLERLDIRLCPGGLTDMGLGYIGKYGHNLKYLILENIGESDAGLVELSKGCPKLRKLEMQSCPFNVQSIASYVFKIRSLRYLWVFYDGSSCLCFSTKLSDKIIVKLSICNLKHLAIVFGLWFWECLNVWFIGIGFEDTQKMKVKIPAAYFHLLKSAYMKDEVDTNGQWNYHLYLLYELDGITRKQVTVHVHYLRNPSRLSQRFPNIKSLTLIGLWYATLGLRIKISPWIRELTVSFKRFNALCIHDMHVDDEDLELLGRTRGKDLRVLKIEGGNGVSKSGLVHVAKYCNQLRTFCFEDDICGNWLRELALHNKVIESLHISTLFDDTDVNDLTLLAKNCSIRNLPVTSYPLLLPLVNQLRELHLPFSYSFEPRCNCFLIERCPNLEVLYTEDVCEDRGLQVVGQFCKKLRKLTYGGRATHMGLIALAEGCRNLENLDVTLLDISNEALDFIGTHLKNLGDFRMNLCKEDCITDLPLDSGIRALLNGCSKLESLNINLCPGGLTDIGLGYIGKYGHNLKFLSLTYVGESDAGLVGLSKGCPKLRELVMMSCPFNKPSVTAIVFNIRSLRYLWFCNQYGDFVATRQDFEASLKSCVLLLIILVFSTFC
ncbi:hypothetical protein CTI12_AA606180 [Artemisia annua]|uniref:COI1 F-box domain-containing protein n=1 Tax=Artemisia annua TaxID=35608 RepID=A0A2U1KGA5_ARTAN|nr:hypothetical protein CTI12_AA606180 [Artemisia annua]